MWDMMQALGLQDRENYYPYEQYGNAQYENLLQQILGTFLEQEYANLDTELNQARNERTQARWSNYFYGPAANPEPEARQEQPRRNPFAGFEGFRNFNFNFNEPNFDVPEQDRQDQPNPHDLLGVAQDATRAEIIRAYRDQALLFHPDQFEANRERLQAEGIHTREQAQVRMAEVNHARDILLGNNN